MDDLMVRLVDGLDAMPPDAVNARSERRFIAQVEAPLAELLGLRIPEKKQDPENVYVTWIGDSNNIDNRLWQVQNKILRGRDPLIAVALCPERITDDHMFLATAKNQTDFSQTMGRETFQGVIVVSTPDDRRTFRIHRLILMEGGSFTNPLVKALPGIPFEYFPAPTSRHRNSKTLPIDDSSSTVRTLLAAYRNVVIEGVSGTGKSHILKELRDEFTLERMEVAVFHPSSSYEDFVEGLRPTTTGDFTARDGRFLRFCKKAANDPERSYLFVIDEINRASPSKVFGDLLYSIEPSKRIPASLAAALFLAETEQGEDPFDSQGGISPAVRLQLSRDRTDGAGTFTQLFAVPDNVFVLGTMNTSDHSIGQMDLALRRRFVFHRFEPLATGTLIERLAVEAETLALLQPEIEAWAAMNEELATVSDDAQLGHSYFFEAMEAYDRISIDDPGQLPIMLWRDLLLPQLSSTLVAFNALFKLPTLDELAATHGSDTGGHWLQSLGDGLDAYPVVAPRASIANPAPEVQMDFTWSPE